MIKKSMTISFQKYDSASKEIKVLSQYKQNGTVKHAPMDSRVTDEEGILKYSSIFQN